MTPPHSRKNVTQHKKHHSVRKNINDNPHASPAKNKSPANHHAHCGAYPKILRTNNSANRAENEAGKIGSMENHRTKGHSRQDPLAETKKATTKPHSSKTDDSENPSNTSKSNPRQKPKRLRRGLEDQPSIPSRSPERSEMATVPVSTEHSEFCRRSSLQDPLPHRIPDTKLDNAERT